MATLLSFVSLPCFLFVFSCLLLYFGCCPYFPRICPLSWMSLVIVLCVVLIFHSRVRWLMALHTASGITKLSSYINSIVFSAFFFFVSCLVFHRHFSSFFVFGLVSCSLFYPLIFSLLSSSLHYGDTFWFSSSSGLCCSPAVFSDFLLPFYAFFFLLYSLSCSLNQCSCSFSLILPSLICRLKFCRFPQIRPSGVDARSRIKPTDSIAERKCSNFCKVLPVASKTLAREYIFRPAVSDCLVSSSLC